MSLNNPSARHENPSDALTRCRAPILRVIEDYTDRSTKRRLVRAADLFGLPYQRVKSYFYDEVRRPTAEEFLRIRRAYRAWCWDKQTQLAHQIAQLRDELRELGDDAG